MRIFIKRNLIVVGLLAILSTLLAAADATGTWKAQITAPDGNHDLTFALKAQGSSLTGTVTENQKPADIQEGKAQGDTVSFSVMIDYQGQPLKIVYKGQVAGDEIRFTIGTEDGGWSTDFVAKRSS